MQAAAILLLVTTVGDTNDWPDYGYGDANVRSASERLIPAERMPPRRRTAQQTGFDAPTTPGTRVRNVQYNDGNSPNRANPSQTETATAPPPTGYGGYTAPPPPLDRAANPRQRVRLPRDDSSYDYGNYRSADSGSAADGIAPNESMPDHGVFRPDESPYSPSQGAYIPPTEAAQPTTAPDTMELPPIGPPPSRRTNGQLDPAQKSNANPGPNYGTPFRDPPATASPRPSTPPAVQPRTEQSTTHTSMPATPSRPLRQSSPLDNDRLGNTQFLTLLTLFGSIGLNVYLGWIAWDTYNRYQDLVSDMRYSGSRRDTEPAYDGRRMADAAY